MFCDVVALQPTGVDEDVEEAADECEHGREDVDDAREEDERERGEDEPELERARRRHATGRDGPLLGALAHQPVDVAVEQVVERARAAARERETDHRRDEEPERRHALRADEHPRRAGHEEQRHDPRLRQRHVVPPRSCLDARASEALHGRDACGGERDRGERDVQAWQRHRRGSSEEDERRERGNEESPVRDPRGHGDGDERRHGERRDVLVPEPERPGDDGEQRSRHAEQRSELQPEAGSRAARAHRAPSASGAGRTAVERSSRRAPSRSSRAAAARSCTTRACRRATDRCPRASRSSASSTR